MHIRTGNSVNGFADLVWFCNASSLFYYNSLRNYFIKVHLGGMCGVWSVYSNDWFRNHHCINNNKNNKSKIWEKKTKQIEVKCIKHYIYTQNDMPVCIALALCFMCFNVCTCCSFYAVSVRVYYAAVWVHFFSLRAHHAVHIEHMNTMRILYFIFHILSGVCIRDVDFKSKELKVDIVYLFIFYLSRDLFSPISFLTDGFDWIMSTWVREQVNIDAVAVIPLFIHFVSYVVCIYVHKMDIDQRHWNCKSVCVCVLHKLSMAVSINVHRIFVK